jgi:hypothetical protein
MSFPTPTIKQPRLTSGWLPHLKLENWRVILILALVTAAACSPIYYHRITVPVDTDYGSHVRFTQEMLNGQGLDPLTLSHPLLQLILAAMHFVTGGHLGLYAALLILQVLVQVITALILYFWFGHGGERRHWDWLRAAAAFSLTFVAPIMLLAFQDEQFYYGYIGLANYHNPTIHLLRPFALLSLMYAVGAAGGVRSSWSSVSLAALWLTLSTWIKPNYALSILPALGLVVIIRWLQRRHLDWRMLIFGFALPGLGMLLIQWLIAYYYGDQGEGIILAPFLVESSYSGNLGLKFLLSCLFPLLVLFIARRNLLEDSGLFMGWAGFLVGAGQFYFLAEGGRRMYDGNFRWSGQIMLFLLFAIALRWLLREKVLARGLRLWERISLSAAYLAQLGGGVAYYIYCMVSIHYR